MTDQKRDETPNHFETWSNRQVWLHDNESITKQNIDYSTR